MFPAVDQITRTELSRAWFGLYINQRCIQPVMNIIVQFTEGGMEFVEAGGQCRIQLMYTGICGGSLHDSMMTLYYCTIAIN